MAKLRLMWIMVLMIPFVYSETCPSGQMLFDSVCYPCENGYLSFNPNDRSITCTHCVDGFKMQNNQCIPENVIVPTNSWNLVIDNAAVMVSGWFGTEDPSLGFMVLLISFIGLLYILLDYFNII